MGNLVRTPHSEVNATLETLDRFGITSDHLARLRAEPEYAKRIAEYMLRGGMDDSVHHKLARAVMGKNFFGVEEWQTLFNVQFTRKQLREVAEFPWGEDILNAPCPFVKGKAVKDTHFAFLGLDRLHGSSLTILKWQEVLPASGQPKFYSYAPQAWYSQEKFAAVPLKLRWYLMLQNIVPNSENRTFDEQKTMLPAEYEVPMAVEEVSKDLLYSKKNDVYLNPSYYARTSECASNGLRVLVGYFVDDRLFVNDNLDDLRHSYIGVAASRKFPSRTLSS